MESKTEKIGIHWIPVFGAREYRGFVLCDRERIPVHAFRLPARPCRVVTERVHLAPGRYSVVVEAVFGPDSERRTTALARRFAVETEGAEPFAAVRPARANALQEVQVGG